MTAINLNMHMLSLHFRWIKTSNILSDLVTGDWFLANIAVHVPGCFSVNRAADLGMD